MCIVDRFGLKSYAFCVHVVGVWMHMLAKLCWWIVVACLWFVKAGGFIWGIRDRFVSTCLALWVHVVCARMHMFATLGWWIVVACLWSVKAGFLMCVSMIDLGWTGVQIV